MDHIMRYDYRFSTISQTISEKGQKVGKPFGFFVLGGFNFSQRQPNMSSIWKQKNYS